MGVGYDVRAYFGGIGSKDGGPDLAGELKTDFER